MAEGDTDDRSWLLRLEARDWVRAGLAEVAKVEGSHDPRAIVAGCKRAAGMGLNGLLRVAFEESWGRSYVDHLRAAAADDRVPEAVRGRCALVLEATPPAGDVIQLRSRRTTEALVEATKDILAWAYAEILKREAE